MSSHRWKGTLPVVILFGVLLLWGCSKDDGQQTAPEFTIHYTTFTPSGTSRTFVVLHDLAGERALAAREVTGPGDVSFPAYGDRVSVSVVNVGDRYRSVYSYLGVSPSEWNYRGSITARTATIDLDVAYPAGNYNELSISTSGVSGTHPIGVHDSATFHVATFANCWPPDTATSILGIIRGDNQSYYGWLLDRAVHQSDSMHLTLTLDQPVEPRTVTFSRPLRSFDVALQHGSGWISSYYEAAFWLPDSVSDAMQFTFAHCAQFPASKMLISGQWYNATDYYEYYGAYSTLPEAVRLPDIEITATYDSTTRDIRNIATSGLIDGLEAEWNGSSNGRNVYWFVDARDGTVSIRRPVLPDSILTILGVDWSTIPADNISAVDYEPASSYDDFVSIRNNHTTSGGDLDNCTSRFVARHNLNSTASMPLWNHPRPAERGVVELGNNGIGR